MGNDELDQAVDVFRRGNYDRVITTGGPMARWREIPEDLTYAERAARYLRKHGLEGTDVIAVSQPESAQDRTFLSAVKVHDWAARQGLVLEALDVFSAGVHGQRSRMLYRITFGSNVDVGVLSAPREAERYWWRTRTAAKRVLDEVIKVLWTMCCFYPPPPGSHEELWGLPAPTARQ